MTFASFMEEHEPGITLIYYQDIMQTKTSPKEWNINPNPKSQKERNAH